MEKIAIYGGSFDPPHKGHKLLARNLAQICGAQRVMIIPTALSPFKTGSKATAADRLQMCRLAFNEPLFEVSDIEMRRGGKSYTVDTLCEVKKIYPQAQLYLFMGDDMFLSFDKWYKYRQILEMCIPVAACRTEDLAKLTDMKHFAEEKLNLGEGEVLICENTPFETSSSEIRDTLKKGLNSPALQEEVYGYIKEKGLYI